MEKIYLLPNTPKYKANLHCHTTFSDGAFTPEEIKKTYKEHGYAVVADTVDPEIARVSHINLNDHTCEGVEHIHAPIFTVQYHPEVHPGPQDTSYLFDQFIDLMDEKKGGAQ